MTDLMAYGDGTITRRPDGRLQVAVVVGGKRLYAMIPKGDPREQRRAAEAKRNALRALREADVNPSGQTLEVYLRSWIEGLREQAANPGRRKALAPRTIEHYAMIAERHIIPALGRVRLDRLNERQIQAWLDRDRGSTQTVHHHRAVLRRALNVARRRRIIPTNPAIDVELEPVTGEHGNPLTFAEASRLLEVTRGDRLHALWHLAIVTGLRQGELLGLGWDDLAGDQLTVQGQLQRRGGSWVRGATKAARSLQSLSLHPTSLAVLEEHRRSFASERTPDWPYFGLMFVTPKGEPWHGAEILRAFHAGLERAGIAKRRFHDLRVTNATLMRERGVPEDVRMARLGHSTTDMARHYAKARPGLDREAANAFADGLREAQ